ncbi:MAG: response regulator transcription factor [Elusimicrobia bacterium]|nr:response regulator transcription factor [Elusimicrobiota bacterium]
MIKLTILIVEDDPATLELLEAAVSEVGHMARTVGTLANAFKSVERNPPDLIIMDRGLPDGDGFKLCLALKRDLRFRAIPILMVSGRGEVAERVLGLRFGADDYLVKPFDMEELLARVDALFRRAHPELAGYSSRIASGGLELDLAARQATSGGKLVRLTPMEYELLRVLVERRGTVLTREFLLESVWGAARGGAGPKTVDVTVMNLRRKLGAAGSLIAAVRAQGYKLLELGNTGT